MKTGVSITSPFFITSQDCVEILSKEIIPKKRQSSRDKQRNPKQVQKDFLLGRKPKLGKPMLFRNSNTTRKDLTLNEKQRKEVFEDILHHFMHNTGLSPSRRKKTKTNKPGNLWCMLYLLNMFKGPLNPVMALCPGIGLYNLIANMHGYKQYGAACAAYCSVYMSGAGGINRRGLESFYGISKKMYINSQQVLKFNARISRLNTLLAETTFIADGRGSHIEFTCPFKDLTMNTMMNNEIPYLLFHYGHELIELMESKGILQPEDLIVDSDGMATPGKFLDSARYDEDSRRPKPQLKERQRERKFKNNRKSAESGLRFFKEKSRENDAARMKWMMWFFIMPTLNEVGYEKSIEFAIAYYMEQIHKSIAISYDDAEDILAYLGAHKDRIKNGMTLEQFNSFMESNNIERENLEETLEELGFQDTTNYYYDRAMIVYNNTEDLRADLIRMANEMTLGHNRSDLMPETNFKRIKERVEALIDRHIVQSGRDSSNDTHDNTTPQ